MHQHTDVVTPCSQCRCCDCSYSVGQHALIVILDSLFNSFLIVKPSLMADQVLKRLVIVCVLSITRKKSLKPEKSLLAIVCLASEFPLMLLYRTKTTLLEWFVVVCGSTHFQGSSCFMSPIVQRGFQHSPAVQKEECFQGLVSYNDVIVTKLFISLEIL